MTFPENFEEFLKKFEELKAEEDTVSTYIELLEETQRNIDKTIADPLKQLKEIEEKIEEFKKEALKRRGIQEKWWGVGPEEPKELETQRDKKLDEIVQQFRQAQEDVRRSQAKFPPEDLQPNFLPIDFSAIKAETLQKRLEAEYETNVKLEMDRLRKRVLHSRKQKIDDLVSEYKKSAEQKQKATFEEMELLKSEKELLNEKVEGLEREQANMQNLMVEKEAFEKEMQQLKSNLQSAKDTIAESMKTLEREKENSETEMKRLREQNEILAARAEDLQELQLSSSKLEEEKNALTEKVESLERENASLKVQMKSMSHQVSEEKKKCKLNEIDLEKEVNTLKAALKQEKIFSAKTKKRERMLQKENAFYKKNYVKVENFIVKKKNSSIKNTEKEENLAASGAFEMQNVMMAIAILLMTQF